MWSDNKIKSHKQTRLYKIWSPYEIESDKNLWPCNKIWSSTCLQSEEKLQTHKKIPRPKNKNSTII